MCARILGALIAGIGADAAGPDAAITPRSRRHMNCCTPTDYKTIFGERTVERDIRRYRKKGLTGSARWLFQALTRGGVSDQTVLEVGGGIGSLQIELLNAGAGHTSNVEIIESYEAAARSLITERGLDASMERHIADFAQHPDQAPHADVVVMHRVICCYPDPEALMTAACKHARDRVAITVPREAWWVKLGFRGMNLWLQLRRTAFRAYVHPLGRMLEVGDLHGFCVTSHDRGAVWESIILQQAPSEAPRAAASS